MGAKTVAKIHESWPATQVELVKVDDLIPYIRNPRQHSAEQVLQLVASMREFGWTMPVLRDENGGIIAGHGRILAARKLEWEIAPCVTAHGWSESKKRAYVIADNKLALNATWDIDLLATEIESLREDDFDIALLGFSDEDLQRLEDDFAAEKFGVAQDGATQEQPQHERGPTTNMVTLDVPMTIEQRKIVFEAINKAKADFNLLLSGDALCRISKQFLGQP